jgi:hypothetical protein
MAAKFKMAYIVKKCDFLLAVMYLFLSRFEQMKPFWTCHTQFYYIIDNKIKNGTEIQDGVHSKKMWFYFGYHVLIFRPIWTNKTILDLSYSIYRLEEKIYSGKKLIRHNLDISVFHILVLADFYKIYLQLQLTNSQSSNDYLRYSEFKKIFKYVYVFGYSAHVIGYLNIFEYFKKGIRIFQNFK